MTDLVAQTSHDQIELVSFRIGEQEFCVDIMAVREIRGWAPATPLPQTPPYMRGVINLRGAVLPILDLAVRLELPATEPSARSVIIVIAADNRKIFGANSQEWGVRGMLDTACAVAHRAVHPTPTQPLALRASTTSRWTLCKSSGLQRGLSIRTWR